MGEQQHLVEVLGQKAKIQRQGLVVLDAALGEAAIRRREHEGVALVDGVEFRIDGRILHLEGVVDGRHVAAPVGAEGRGEFVGGDFVEVAAEHLAVGFLRQGLGFFQQVPHALGKVEICLGQLALGDHPAHESIPAARIEPAGLGFGGPATAQQQFALVALVAGVQDGVQQFGLAGVALREAERVAKFRRRDAARLEGWLDGFQQVAVPLEVGGGISPVAVGGLADGLEHETPEAARDLAAVHAIHPGFHPAQRGAHAHEVAHTLLALGHGLAFARCSVRHAEFFQAADKLLGDLLAVDQLPVDLDQALAPGQIPQAFDVVGQRAQFAHGQFGQGLGVLLGIQQHGFEHREQFRVVAFHGFHVLARILATHANPVLGQDGARCIHDVEVPGLGYLLGFRVGNALERGRNPLRLGLGFIGGARGRVLDQLEPLLPDGFLDVALLEGVLGRLAGSCLGRCVLGRAKAAGFGVLDHPGGVVLRHFGEHLGTAHGLLQARQFSGEEPAAHVVVDGLVGGLGDGLGRCQFAVAFQHAQVGGRLDNLTERLGVEHLAYHGVAGLEAEHFRHHIGVQTLVGEHAVFTMAQALPIDGAQRALGEHCAQGRNAQAVAGRGLDGFALGRSHFAMFQPAHGGIDGLLRHLGFHLAAGFLALGSGIAVQALDRFLA